MENLILKIGPHQISNFIGFQIDSNLYKPTAGFRLELAPTTLEISAGQMCELYVNGSKELTGIVDRVSKSVTKEGRSLTLEGRDLMGLVVDSYCEEFGDLKETTLKAVTEKLLAKIRFINTKKIIYEKNIIGKMKTKKSNDPASILGAVKNYPHIDVGMTIFEALKTLSFSVGLLFYCLPDGTFAYTRPKAGGAAAFKIQMLNEGSGNNALRGDVVDDISKRYSHVYVITQTQGCDDISTAFGINSKATAKDSDFPYYSPLSWYLRTTQNERFYYRPKTINLKNIANLKGFPFYKPYVTQLNDDSMSAQNYARIIMEKMRRQGFHLTYEVSRYSQDGKNWKINELCQVNDNALNIQGTFLIYRRTFMLSKREGPITRVHLGLPGLINIED